jgi:heptosyltransferase III
MPARPARILVLRGGALGDFIVTLPALRALRQRWPDGRLEAMGYPRVARLGLLGGLVDQVHSLDQAGLARFFAALPLFTEEQAAFIRSFDIVLNYLHDPQDALVENLRAAGARVLISASPLVVSGHAVDHFLKPLQGLAIYDADGHSTVSCRWRPGPVRSAGRPCSS